MSGLRAWSRVRCGRWWECARVGECDDGFLIWMGKRGVLGVLVSLFLAFANVDSVFISSPYQRCHANDETLFMLILEVVGLSSFTLEHFLIG